MPEGEDRSGATPPTPGSNSPDPWRMVALWGVLLLPYLGIRGVYWRNTPVLEDHDSVTYLLRIPLFRELDLGGIVGMSPDATPFLPMLGALFTLPGLDPETAVRVASLASSSVLLAVVLIFAARLGSFQAAVAAGAMLTLSPALVPVSYAVLTEASYIATVFLGVLLLWLHRDRPTPWRGVLLGVIFALAFLNRLEGLLFLAMVPALQWIHWLGVRVQRGSDPLPGTRDLVTWTACFVLTFGLLSAPQVWRVSHEMGGFALNGRQAWAALLLPDGPASNEERIYGLDYSASAINLEHVWRSPETRASLSAGLEPTETVKHALFNLDDVNRRFLAEMAGPIVLALFGLGVGALVARRRYYDLLFIAIFLATVLAAPLLQSIIALRHVLVMAPMLYVVAGVGLGHLAGMLPQRGGLQPPGWALLTGVLALLALSWFVPLFQAYNRLPNLEYDPASLEGPRRALLEDHDGLGEAPVLVARKHYLAWKADAVPLELPFTDLGGLTEFLQERQADYVFLEYHQLRERPFIADFQSDPPPPGFRLLHRGETTRGERLELYRFLPEALAAGNASHFVDGENTEGER